MIVYSYSICKLKLSYFNDEWIWWISVFWVRLLSLIPIVIWVILAYEEKITHRSLLFSSGMIERNSRIFLRNLSGKIYVQKWQFKFSEWKSVHWKHFTLNVSCQLCLHYAKSWDLYSVLSAPGCRLLRNFAPKFVWVSTQFCVKKSKQQSKNLEKNLVKSRCAKKSSDDY